VVEGRARTLLFVGPHFLYSPSSTMIHGIGAMRARRGDHRPSGARGGGGGLRRTPQATSDSVVSGRGDGRKDLSIPAYAQCECRDGRRARADGVGQLL